MENQIVRRVKVNTSEGFEGGAFHQANTLVFSLSGPHVFRFNYALMASVLMGPCGIGKQGIKSIYRFQDSKRWYATLTPEAKAAHYERLHGMKHELQDPKVTILIENIEKEQTKATIHWMPTTAKVETVKQIAEEISGDVNAEVHKLKNSTDKWLLLCNPKEPLPHYVDMELDGVADKLHRLFITVPGRRTACTFCGEDSHWSNKCPTKEQTQKGARPTQSGMSNTSTDKRVHEEDDGFQLVTRKRKLSTNKNLSDGESVTPPTPVTPVTTVLPLSNHDYPTPTEAHRANKGKSARNFTTQRKTSATTGRDSEKIDTPPPQRSLSNTPPRRRSLSDSSPRLVIDLDISTSGTEFTKYFQK